MNINTNTIHAEQLGKKLLKPARTLLCISGFNALANSLSNIFVNVYFYKLTQNLYETLLFTLVSYIVWLPSFILAGWLSKRWDRKKALWIGSMLQVAFYVPILVLGESSVHYIPFFGVIYGIGSGFYWLSVNVLTVDLTTPGNRNWFNGVNGILGSLTQMFGPLTAGWIIASMTDLTGYTLIFGLSFGCFLVSLLFSLLLPENREQGRFAFGDMLRAYKRPEWRHISHAFVGLAFREGVLSTAVWIWIYMASGSEGTTGNYAFLTTSLSVAMYYLIGKYGREERRWAYLVASSVLFSLSLIGLISGLNAYTLLAYGLLDAVCRPLFDTPFYTMTYNAISRNGLNGRLTVELTVWREIALSIGRISSVGLLVLLYKMTDAAVTLPWFLLLIVLVGLTPLYFLSRIAANTGRL